MLNAAGMLGLNLRAGHCKSGTAANSSRSHIAAAQLGQSATPSEWSCASRTTAEDSEVVDGVSVAEDDEIQPVQVDAKQCSAGGAPGTAASNTAHHLSSTQLATATDDDDNEPTCVEEALGIDDAAPQYVADVQAIDSPHVEAEHAQTAGVQFEELRPVCMEQDRHCHVDAHDPTVSHDARGAAESSMQFLPHAERASCQEEQQHPQQDARVAADLALLASYTARASMKSARTRSSKLQPSAPSSKDGESAKSESGGTASMKVWNQPPAAAMTKAERVAADIALLQRIQTRKAGHKTKMQRSASQPTTNAAKLSRMADETECLATS